MNDVRDNRLPPVPLNEEDLLNPSIQDALNTVGFMIHWVTSDPELVARFTTWTEHHPGDLTTDLVYRVLAATHDVLVPLCPDKIPPVPS